MTCKVRVPGPTQAHVHMYCGRPPADSIVWHHLLAVKEADARAAALLAPASYAGVLADAQHVVLFILHMRRWHLESQVSRYESAYEFS